MSGAGRRGRPNWRRGVGGCRQVSDRLHGGARLDLFEQKSAQRDASEKRAGQRSWALASTSLASTPRQRSVHSPASDNALPPISASGTPDCSAVGFGHSVTDSRPGSMRALATIVLRVVPRCRPLSAEQSDPAAEETFLRTSGMERSDARLPPAAPSARNELTALCDQPPRNLTLAAPSPHGREAGDRPLRVSTTSVESL